MNWKKVARNTVIGAGIGALAPVIIIPLIGGFGMVAMGGAIGTGLVTGIAGLLGGTVGAGSEVVNQLAE